MAVQRGRERGPRSDARLARKAVARRGGGPCCEAQATTPLWLGELRGDQILFFEPEHLHFTFGPGQNAAA